MADQRFKVTLAFEVTELTPRGERPFFAVPGMTWAECPAETVLVLERRLLDLLESMHTLGLDVLQAKGDADALGRILRRHTAAGPVPETPDIEVGRGPEGEGGDPAAGEGFESPSAI